MKMELIKRTPEFSFYQKAPEHYRLTIHGVTWVETDNKHKAKVLLEMVRFLKTQRVSKKAIKEILVRVAYGFLFQFSNKVSIKHDVILNECRYFDAHGRWED